MEETKNKFYLTWKDVKEFVDEVCKTPRNFTGVYGPARGGLVPAVMISHKLGIPMLSAPHKGCIIVDDICDSGETLLHYVNNSSNPQAENDYYIATLCKKDSSPIAPDYYKFEVPDVWVVFPWEEWESSKYEVVHDV